MISVQLKLSQDNERARLLRPAPATRRIPGLTVRLAASQQSGCVANNRRQQQKGTRS